MSAAPLTPAEDADSPQPVGNALRNVPYDEQFENQLMKSVLYPDTDLPSTQPTPQDTENLGATTLPVPLDSPLRTHRSPIPGVLLTHPNGYHTGGPGPSPGVVGLFAEEFISKHNITTAQELEDKVSDAIKERLDEARERFLARQAALRKNDDVKKEIQTLHMQRQAEERVEERMRRGRERKGENI